MTTREQRIEIYRDTLTLATNLRDAGQLPPFVEGQKYTHEKIASMPLVAIDPTAREPRVRVWEQNVVDVILTQVAAGQTALVLNMANKYSYGGGVREGDSAQEEELFRKTDYALHPTNSAYPLEPEALFATPHVTVLKRGDARVVSRDDRRSVMMMAVAGADLRVGDGSRFRPFTRQTREFMRAKIQTLFRFARLARARHLILGALGCGAFGCPASEVMPLFREAIAEHGRAFERIDFAILPHRDNVSQFRALETR